MEACAEVTWVTDVQTRHASTGTRTMQYHSLDSDTVDHFFLFLFVISNGTVFLTI